ncbi:MAG: DUF4922 domain-containing protein [Bacteroidota bacterium]
MDRTRILKNILLLDDELGISPNESDLAVKARALLAQQKHHWKLLRQGYESLATVETRTFEFDGFVINVQFNPGRIISSSANVDEKSIKERKCFLCVENLPHEQRAVMYKDEYLILGNPYPIFSEHFTIAHRDHQPQAISGSFTKLLDLSKDLQRYYLVFYNGPRCGASAPDHMHFQAGDKTFLPIEREYDTIKQSLGEKLFENEKIVVCSVTGYLRNFVALESTDKQTLKSAFGVFLSSFAKMANTADEPMVNIISAYEIGNGAESGRGKWRVVIFPRAAHRPSHYYAEGERNILISPAAVDLGGVFITPLRKDFDKITKNDIVNILREVTLPSEAFKRLTRELSERLHDSYRGDTSQQRDCR